MIQGFVVLAIAGCMWASVCLAVPTSDNVNKSPEVVLKTDKGDITIRLDAEKAPKSVANFLQYVNEGFYDGTIFHRVIKNFMIQGGGFTTDMNQKPTHATVANEADNGLKNKRGSIAMARTADPDSATAQFFINVVDNPFLDHRAKTRADYGYTVFGEVIDGLDVVDAIRNVSTGNAGMYQDVPKEPVKIISAKVKQ